MARNKSEVSYKFKINFKDADNSNRDIKDSSTKTMVKKAVGDYLVEETLKRVGEGKTGISKGKYNKTLTKDYKKEKGKISSSKISNMELHGNMLDQLKSEPYRDGVEIAIKGDEAPKAFAHHTSYRGHKFIKDRNTYKREFIPNKDQKYMAKIVKEVDAIVESFREDSGDE